MHSQIRTVTVIAAMLVSALGLAAPAAEAAGDREPAGT